MERQGGGNEEHGMERNARRSCSVHRRGGAKGFGRVKQRLRGDRDLEQDATRCALEPRGGLVDGPAPAPAAHHVRDVGRQVC